MARRLSLARVALCCAVILVSSVIIPLPRATADIIEWTDPNDGDFDVAGNWTVTSGFGAPPPNVNDTATFNETGTYEVTFNADEASDVLNVVAGSITFRSNGIDRAYNITTGAADASIDGANFTLGVAGDPLALIIGDRLDVGGGGTFSVLLGSDVTASNLQLGTGTGNGFMIVAGAGSTLTVNTSTDLGLSGSIGTLQFQNGSTGNILSGTVNLGGFSTDGSTGRLTVFGDATLQTDSINVGQSTTSMETGEGTLTVDGPLSALTQTGASTLTVGDDVNSNVLSTVNISNSGVMHSGVGAILIRNFGHLNVSSGTFNANGNVTIDFLATLTEGVSASANFALGNGLSLTAQNSAQLNFNKDYTIDNDTTWTLKSGADYNTDSTFDDLFVGDGTNGTLVVENFDSSLNVGNGTNGIIQIGENGATGAVTIRDSATAFLGTLDVADDSDAGTTGVLTIESGAIVTVDDVDIATVSSAPADTVTGTVTVGGVVSSPDAQLNINGGGSIRLGTSSAGLGGNSGTMNVLVDGVVNSGTGTTNVLRDSLLNIDGGVFNANGDIFLRNGELRVTTTSGSNLNLSNGVTIRGQENSVLDFQSSFTIANDQAVEVTAGTDMTVDNLLFVGALGSSSGTLIVEGAGSTLTVTSLTLVGGNGGTGSLTLRDNASATLERVDIAESSVDLSTGIVRVENGADVTSTDLEIVRLSSENTTGSLTITGSGSTWSATILRLGNDVSGTAELNILSGGTFSTTSSASFEATGVMTVNGGTVALGSHIVSGGRIDFISGSLTSGSSWTIEPGGILGSVVDLTPGKHLATTSSSDLLLQTSGTLILNGGSLDVDDITDSGGTLQFNSGTLTLRAFNAFNIDAASVFGSAFTLGANQHVVLSDQGVVTNGSQLTLSGGTLNSTANISNSGSIVLVGPGAALGGTTLSNNSGGIVRGEGTISAALNNSAGGEIRGEAGKTLLFTAAPGANAGQISLQGGTVQFAQALTNGATGNILGRGTLDVGGTGLTNEGDLALSNGQTDIFGDVDNQTTGRVIVSGNADVTFWDDVTDTGTLFNVSTGSSATFFGDAGFGISGGGDTFFEADVTPGASPGLETFGGNVHFGVLANLQIEIAGTVPGAEFDVLNVLGDVTLGGTLDVSLLNPFTLSAGQSFEFIDVGGSLSGTFAGLAEGGLVGNFGGTDLLITYAGGDGNDVTLLSALPGDFDIDGDVDGFDFLGWQRGESPNALSASDLADWEANYGTVASPITAASTAVPEPTTWIVLLIGMATMLLRRDVVVT